MESLTLDKGIFMQLPNMDSKCMLESMLLLLDIQPGLRISGFYSDKIFEGIRVFFEERKSTVTFLKKQSLQICNKNIRIYPLSTLMTIHDIFMGTNDSSEAIVRQEIRKNFGEVLNLYPAPKTTPSFLNKNWRVEIEIPEMSHHKIFTKNGYPKMSLNLPNKSGAFRLTFWCRFCKEDGHTQQECVKHQDLAKSHEIQKKSATLTERSRPTDIKMKPITNHTEQNSPFINATPSTMFRLDLKDTDSFARQLGKEEIMKAVSFTDKNVNRKELSKACASNLKGQAVNNNDKLFAFQEENDPNYQGGESSDKVSNGRNSPKLSVNQTNDITVKKEPEFSEFEDTCPGFADGNNPTRSEDDEVQIMDVIENNSKGVECANSKSNPGIGSSTITGQTHNSSIKFSFHVGSTNRSPQNNFVSLNVPGTSGENTNPFSQRLRDCFKRAYETYPVLDEQQLNAFLIHVKKKSNPMRVAGNYTKNVKGLKDQLKQILFCYYNTPQAGSKDDIQYVKWLNGLVERFDGTPCKKRKRNDKSD